MFIVSQRKYFYVLSGILALASVIAISLWGLKPGIDFKGGSILEVAYEGPRPSIEEAKESLSRAGFDEASLRTTGEKGFILRQGEISLEEKAKLLSVLKISGEAPKELRFSSIGPLLGQEAIEKSFLAIILVILGIVIFITFAFRKVSEPISSWKYGLIAIVALIHDILIPAGVFSVLGHFYGIEVDTLFVTALLVVLGFSIHDTIVVFDRVRENLKNNPNISFENIIGKSLSETIVRSINTSLTVAIALLTLYFLGSDSTKLFSLTLLIGIVAGTYSSIFLASPLLATIWKLQKRARG